MTQGTGSETNYISHTNIYLNIQDCQMYMYKNIHTHIDTYMYMYIHYFVFLLKQWHFFLSFLGKH